MRLVKTYKKLYALCAVFVGVIFLLPVSLQAAKDLTFFRLGTGAQNGPYYTIGGEVSNIISNPPGSYHCHKGGGCGVPGLVSIIQTTSGSAENIALVNERQIDAALVQSNIAYLGYHGLAPFAEENKKYNNIRSVIRLFREYFYIIVRKDSNIDTIEDLLGKKISLGAKKSGTFIDAMMILETYGISDKIIPLNLDRHDALEQLAEGQIDAVFYTSCINDPMILELTERSSVKFLDIAGEKVDELLKKLTFYKQDIVPLRVYNQSKDLKTISSGALLIAHKDVSENLIYQITSLLYAPTHLSKEEEELRKIKIDKLYSPSNYSIPLHPGAERYYKEHGIVENEE